MKHFEISVYLLIIIFLLSACVSEEQKKKTVSLSGAFALYPMVIKWSEEYRESQPEVRFNISAGGAGKGMADAMGGAVDMGMFSREITQTEEDQGVWWVAVAKDAVLPTISANNEYLEILKKRGLTREELRGIFIEQTINSWGHLLNKPNSKKIVSYTRSDASGAAATWAQYLGGRQEDLRGIGVHGDPALAQAVSKDVHAIGFNNTIYVYDLETGEKREGIEVVPLDLNANGQIDPEERFYESFDSIRQAISRGNYPSPPARDLYLVAKGKPEKQAARDFIQWILTKGQKYIKEAGYVPLTDEKIEHNLEKIQ